MKELRIARLILALPIADITFIKKHLKNNANKVYGTLFLALELLRTKELTREEIYLRVYKKKWNPKVDAAFRTDMSRLADIIEDLLIEQRLRERILKDEKLQAEERMRLYIALNLNNEAEQFYDASQKHTTISQSCKNNISDIYTDFIMRNHLSLKDKVKAMEDIKLNYIKNISSIQELQEAKVWFLRCMYNYYFKQHNNKFFETIAVKKLLQIADTYTSIEAKFTLLNGLAYMKIDSPPADIPIQVYEDVVTLSDACIKDNPTYLTYKIKALHLIGTRYSIMGEFKKGNNYFEQAIALLHPNQYKNYKTIILNYATNCSKLKQFDKALKLVNLLEQEAAIDKKLKAECAIRSLSCYLFMHDAKAIHTLVSTQDYNSLQPHEKIYFRLCQCNAFIMEREYELANVEINNLLRSKLMQEIDADFLPATELINFMVSAIFKNGKVQLTTTQYQQLVKLKEDVNYDKHPYLQHYSPYLWLEQKLIKMI